VQLTGEAVRLRTDDGRLLVVMAAGEDDKCHLLVALGAAAVQTEHKVRC
jgi:hypothetical protein